MTNVLKPCPFCGSEASPDGVVRYGERYAAEQGWKQDEFYYCNCMNCGANNKGLSGHETRDDAIAAWNRRALSEPAAPAGVEVVKAFGLESPETETLRANGLKPDEIAGDPVTQAKRVRELLHWFVRLPRGSANPKWTREHAFELAYYIATTDDRAPLDIDEIQKAAWLKGVKATHAERDMMLRHGFITKAEFDAALATPQPVEPPDDTLNDIAAGNEAARDDEWGEAGEKC